MEEIPRTAPMLNMLEPIKFPIVIPTSFFRMEIIEAVNSGKLVPTATIVTEITLSDTPKLEAIEEAPSTIQSDPNANPAKEAIRSGILSHKLLSGFSISFSSDSPWDIRSRTIVYMTKIRNTMKPSHLLNSPSIAKKAKNRAMSIITLISKVIIFLVTKKGNKRAVNPAINPILAILDPKTFPKAISGCPPNAALVLTNNSGADVPNATIVNPITKEDNFSCLAMSDAELTKKFPDKINRAKPPINIKYSILFFFSCILCCKFRKIRTNIKREKFTFKQSLL